MKKPIYQLNTSFAVISDLLTAWGFVAFWTLSVIVCVGKRSWIRGFAV